MSTSHLPNLVATLAVSFAGVLFGGNLAYGAPPLAIVNGPTLTMDPNGSTPLAGLVEASTNVPAQAAFAVSSATESWSVGFPEYRTDHDLALLGLQPDTTYTVEVEFSDEAGNVLVASPPLQAVTGPLPADFPSITVFVSQPAKMEPGFTLLDSIGRRDGGTRYSIIVDSQGQVVWYSTMGGNATKRLPNGNLLRRVASTLILESDLLDNVMPGTIPLDAPSVSLHHDLFPTEYGTFLSLSRETITVADYPTSTTDPNAPTQTTDIQDEPVVEFGPDGTLLNEWPLAEILDTTRINYSGLVNVRGTSETKDWVHTNAVLHDPRDDSIIVSVRHQDAVIKFDRVSGRLKWILGPHANWKQEFQQYLLQPIGALEWHYHPHAPMITPTGNILLFDNHNFGASPFDGNPQIDATQNVSRAVEYAIDEESMEVSQVWEYTGSFDDRLYAGFVGDADWMPETGNVLIDFGGTSYIGGQSTSSLGLGDVVARVVEVDHKTPAEKVFDLMVFNPADRVSVYRAERIPSLYPSKPDSDGDGIPDPSDTCVDVDDAVHRDADRDGYGDSCDPDYNNDGAVGIPDFNVFRSQFGLTDEDPGFNPLVDHNGDGAIGIPDFNVFRRYFGQAPGPSGLACAGTVPCP